MIVKHLDRAGPVSHRVCAGSVRGAGRPPEGIALVLAVLVLLALGTITAGILFVSTQTLRIARTGEDVLRVRLAAESAARAVLAGWQTRRYRDLSVGGTRIAESGGHDRDAERVAVVERLAGGLFLVHGTAIARSGAHAGAGLLVRGLDLPDLWAAFPAAVTAQGTVRVGGGATVEGGDGSVVPPPWAAEDCPTGTGALLREIFGDEQRPATAPTAALAGAGTPEPSDPLRIGPLGMPDLRDLADRAASGELRPAPVHHAGECRTTAAGNWGAPFAPDGPCGDVFPLIFAPGDLHLTGGMGQGVLVVVGDLTLSGDTHFYGPVLAGGQVRITGEAAVYGAVTAVSGRPVSVTGRATVSYGACPIHRALNAAAGLNRPLAPGSRVWLPAF